ncbi:MAG: tetrapyrrole methylase family protein / MazG family protein [Candidatus Sumerlaeota bacterium]|nr:tetrapyrrole methylase family protein / MazG family protein [Candidatus Sumerlaeota bacterium]
MSTPTRKPAPENPDSFRRLVEIMDRLLAPDGCPWDREQTHATLKPHVVEEAYEVCEAIDDGDLDELCTELGDLGLQIVFHAALARREGHFDVDEVYHRICEKLIRRHPHVFAETTAEDPETVLKNWERIKREERAEKTPEKPPSALDGVPVALPGLQRAHRLQGKAAKVGFDWATIGPVWQKIHEEIDELREEHEKLDRDKIEGELGDLFFALVNLARFLKVDPEQALQRTNRKFIRRFHYLEERAREQGRAPDEMTLEEMDALWEESKKKLPEQGETLI